MIITVVLEDSTLMVDSNEIVTIVLRGQGGEILLKNSQKITGSLAMIQEISKIWCQINGNAKREFLAE